MSVITYLVILYTRRPGKNSERKDIFLSTIFLQSENKYMYNISKINMTVSEVDYGVKVWHSNGDIESYTELKNKYDKLVKSYSESPSEIINKMEEKGILPQKQDIFKRVKTFIYLWWKFKNEKNNCYYDYFKLCSLFY